MAHPKTRQSKRRTRARRTHYKAGVPQVAKCAVTGEAHLYHRAYFDEDGNMRYRGKVLVRAKEEAED